MRLTAPPSARTGLRDTEGMAVASFVLGLVGLLVLNLVLGPARIVLASSPCAVTRHAASVRSSAWGWASRTSSCSPSSWPRSAAPWSVWGG